MPQMNDAASVVSSRQQQVGALNASAAIRHPGTLRRLVGKARGVLSAAGSQPRRMGGST